jgi:hypothetical protein
VNRPAAALALSAAVLLLAPAEASAGDYLPRIEQFMATLKAGKTNEALDALYASNKWMARSSDQVQNVQTQLASAEKLMGSLRAWEKLQDIQVGTRFVYVSYVVVYDRQPIRFEFEFFRPGDEWYILSFSFDAKLDDDVEQAARAQLLRR